MGASIRRWLQRLDLVVIAVVFLALVPVLRVQRTTDFIVFCLYVLSFDLVYGHMGRLSFGHMLYLGAGAYGAALCSAHLSASPLVALAASVAIAGGVGLLLGPLVVRTTGACFALINLAFNQVGHFVVLIAAAAYTGGEDGMTAAFARIGPVDLARRNHMFVFALACLLAAVWLVRRLTGSPFGILLRSVKEKEERVRFLGYDTARFKLAAFVLSTSLAGLAGGLSALNYGYVTPSFIDPARNVEVIFAALIGGAGSVYGALVGGVAYMMISNFLPDYVQRWEMFLGLALLFLVFRFRSGIWGWVARRAPSAAVETEVAP
ncbi:MAG TPA: branched-chain amino acid ABC transporter permease [Anaeromyxobacteraceae bacterium]|nr:branched-chain amino acid ABC transporter permease [Anaeromyxobacteraceae bacterium]